MPDNLSNTRFDSLKRRLPSLRDAFILLGLGVSASMVLMLVLTGSPKNASEIANRGTRENKPNRLASAKSGVDNPFLNDGENSDAIGDTTVGTRRRIIAGYGPEGPFKPSDVDRNEKPGLDQPKSFTNSSHGLSSTTTPDLKDSSQLGLKDPEDPESLRQAVNRFLTDVEARLNQRIAALLALYGLADVNSALSNPPPSHINRSLGRDVNPVLGLYPLSYSPAYEPGYKYDEEQQAHILRIQALDANLLALVAHSLATHQFPQVDRYATEYRKRLADYRVLLSEKRSHFIFQTREIYHQLLKTPINGQRVSGLIELLYGQLDAKTPRSQLVAVLNSILRLLENSGVVFQRKDLVTIALHSFISRASGFLSAEKLADFSRRLSPIHNSEQLNFALARISQLFALVSTDPHQRYEQLFGDAALINLPLRLKTIRDHAGTHIYGREYARSLQLLDAMIAYYDGQDVMADRVTQLRGIRTQVERDRQGS